jgi:hypothetical protein
MVEIDCACLPTLRYVALASLVGAAACAGGGPIGSAAWLPPEDGDDDGSSSGDSGDSGDSGGDVEGEGEGIDSGTDDGGSTDDGGVTAAPSSESDSGSTDDGGAPGPATEACFPGAANDWTTCLPLHAFAPEEMPSGYGYPEALDGDPNYRKPVAFIDLQEVAGDTLLAPNFQLLEIAQIEKGRWAIVQPHAVASLQELRDALGAIGVNSGYRSPDYNLQIGGVTWSRHMYGDGFDLDPIDSTLTALEGQCTAIGGFLVEYDTHVHCDFRNDTVDEGFFGGAGEEPAPGELAFAADVIEHGDGVYTATATGFDEGEPKRRWIAYDEDGEVLATETTAVFVVPEDAVEVEVVVGGVVTVSRERS